MTTTKREPMPAWLQDQLVADGTMTGDFITRTLRPRHCRACAAPVLAAIDDLGLTTHIDPAPLTPEGELLALLAGRPTFATFGADLCHRWAGEITHRPASTRAVYAAHQCGAAPLPVNREFVKANTRTNYATDPIPF